MRRGKLNEMVLYQLLVALAVMAEPSLLRSHHGSNHMARSCLQPLNLAKGALRGIEYQQNTSSTCSICHFLAEICRERADPESTDKDKGD